MEVFETCWRCRKRVPIEYCDWIHCNGRHEIQCADCALITRNEFLGVPLDTPFHGEIAREMWEDYQEYKKKEGGAMRDISGVVNAMVALDEARSDLEKAIDEIKDKPNTVIAARCYLIEKADYMEKINKLLIDFMLGPKKQQEVG